MINLLIFVIVILLAVVIYGLCTLMKAYKSHKEEIDKFNKSIEENEE